MLPPGKPGDVTGVGAPATTETNPQGSESVRSDVPFGKKCSRSLSGFSLGSDTTLCYSNSVRPPTGTLTQRATTADGLDCPAAASEATGGRERPAARQQATFGSAQPGSPERRSSAPRAPHTTDQPAAGACPRPGRPSAPPSGARGVLRGAVRVDRFEAVGASGLHLTLVRTTQERLYRPGSGGPP